MNPLALLISTFFFTGYAPVAPGTFGSAAGLVLFGVLRFAGAEAQVPAVACGLALVGVWAASVTARSIGRSDPGIVVVDEVVGMLVTVAWLPLSAPGLFAAFFLFRIFDILKPFPAAQSEALPGGWGIMADDVFAGVYASLAVRILAWLWPSFLLV
ncbi:MAG: phosphatidylglycerophosphatase A [Vicinamibacterales bacterium]